MLIDKTQICMSVLDVDRSRYVTKKEKLISKCQQIVTVNRHKTFRRLEVKTGIYNLI